MAALLGLPRDWLNDGVKGYVQGFAPGEVLMSGRGLVVRTLAAHQLLAMKLSAWRDDLDVAVRKKGRSHSVVAVSWLRRVS